jgi:hypothetical protein
MERNPAQRFKQSTDSADTLPSAFFKNLPEANAGKIRATIF